MADTVTPTVCLSLSREGYVGTFIRCSLACGPGVIHLPNHTVVPSYFVQWLDEILRWK